jgi:tetratricopeptide (TPR) repeat protein
MTYPDRHRNHEIETLSDRFLNNKIPISWVINKFTVDYGTDYNCEISLEGKVSGINFTIQLKGKETDTGKGFILIKNIKRTTINRWINRLEPTMIVAYIVNENEAYWTWFDKNMVDLTKNNKIFQIKIPRDKPYSKIDWESVTSYLIKVFKRKNLLYDIPEKDENEDVWSLFFDKKFDKALTIFKDLAKSQNDALILNALAVCHYELYQYREALIAINEAIALKDSKSLYLNKASILTELGTLNKDKHILFQAIDIYKNLMDNEEISEELIYNYSNALRAVGDFESARLLLDEVIQMNPNNAQAWKNLGSIFWEYGMHNKELDCYNKALNIQPDLQEALFSKGLTLYKAFGETEKGIDFMIRSTKISDRFKFDFPHVYFWIAEAFLTIKLIKDAKKWNLMGLDIVPSDIPLLKQKNRIEKYNN